MALDKWAAVASLGLFAMFAGEISLLYNGMVNSVDEPEKFIAFEANPKILQFISIGVAPASIMAALSYILSKRFGSRRNGALIAAGGAVMLGGMALCHTMLDRVPEQFVTDAVNLVPPLFIGVSVAVIAAGLSLFRVRKRRPKKDYILP